MSRGWKIFTNSAAFVFLILLFLLFFLYRFLTESLTSTDGTAQLETLEQKVEIYRDSVGVPHIFAESKADLFRAAGYVVAQDRLWQMDFFRRVAAGRLSEVMGTATIEYDKFMRMCGFVRIAHEIERTLSPESRLILQAYADGINSFVAAHRGELPIEFALLGYEPGPWQIKDSLAFTRFMAWKLSFSWYVDLTLHELVAKVGSSKASEVFPDFPENGPFILSNSSDLKPAWQAFRQSGLNILEFLGSNGGRLGSNSWVVSGAKTTSGKPLLANDPHLELSTPSIWYEMHLSGGGLDAAGVTFPGVPGIVIGHNQHIAWGLTNGMVDDMDFYFERVSPDSANRYWDGKSWLVFEEVEEEIRIKK